MKLVLIVLFSVFTITATAQGKRNAILYDDLTVIESTPYVVATIRSRSTDDDKSKQIMFVNTKTGEAKEFGVSDKGYIGHIDQIKIEDKVIVVAQNPYGNPVKMAVVRTPIQIFILSGDKDPIRIVEDNFIISKWVLKQETATIVITGYYDIDNNGKYNIKDKGEVHVYDIKNMRTLSII